MIIHPTQRQYYLASVLIPRAPVPVRSRNPSEMVHRNRELHETKGAERRSRTVEGG